MLYSKLLDEACILCYHLEPDDHIFQLFLIINFGFWLSKYSPMVLTTVSTANFIKQQSQKYLFNNTKFNLDFCLKN